MLIMAAGVSTSGLLMSDHGNPILLLSLWVVGGSSPFAAHFRTEC